MLWSSDALSHRPHRLRCPNQWPKIFESSAWQNLEDSPRRRKFAPTSCICTLCGEIMYPNTSEEARPHRGPIGRLRKPHRAGLTRIRQAYPPNASNLPLSSLSSLPRRRELFVRSNLDQGPRPGSWARKSIKRYSDCHQTWHFGFLDLIMVYQKLL